MAADQGRMMKYPYTLTAKIGQFPWKFYLNNHWQMKYFLIGIGLSLPVFAYFNKLANSPANVKKWQESKAKEAAEHHH